MRTRWLVALAVGSASVGLAFVQSQEGSPPAEPQSVSVQPIDFPHDTHAGLGEGQYGMDCMYCHFSADRSVDAGIPPVSTCMGCHTVVAGANNPEEVQKVRDYFQRGEPIPWVRIYKVSDHVHFPHMRHVDAGLACQSCHGQVQEMGAIEARAPEWGGDNMGWCISCHVQEGASRDCAVCHY